MPQPQCIRQPSVPARLAVAGPLSLPHSHILVFVCARLIVVFAVLRECKAERGSQAYGMDTAPKASSDTVAQCLEDTPMNCMKAPCTSMLLVSACSFTLGDTVLQTSTFFLARAQCGIDSESKENAACGASNVSAATRTQHEVRQSAPLHLWHVCVCACAYVRCSKILTRLLRRTRASAEERVSEVFAPAAANDRND